MLSPEPLNAPPAHSASPVVSLPCRATNVPPQVLPPGWKQAGVEKWVPAGAEKQPTGKTSVVPSPPLGRITGAANPGVGSRNNTPTMVRRGKAAAADASATDRDSSPEALSHLPRVDNLDRYLESKLA